MAFHILHVFIKGWSLAISIFYTPCSQGPSLGPSPNFHVTSPESGSGRDFLGSAESACLENATPNQITGLLQVK